MRYASFFSGVEMASVAWKPLGWELVSTAEIDPFACWVLHHRHGCGRPRRMPDPDAPGLAQKDRQSRAAAIKAVAGIPECGVPNLGDVSQVTDDEMRALGQIDLCIGGFPCQDLSHAGKRKGLRHDDGTTTRSGLFFDAMRLVRASGCRWLTLENVPGIFSSNGGRDFGEVVAHIVGCGFDVPDDGWQNAGAATGPRGAVCWRTLDAQYAGLAQRRERVFVVADFGEGAATAPLFPLLESVPRHPPACVAARQRPSVRAPGRPRRKGIWEQIAEAFRPGGAVGPTPVAPTVPARKLGGGVWEPSLKRTAD